MASSESIPYPPALAPGPARPPPPAALALLTSAPCDDGCGLDVKIAIQLGAMLLAVALQNRVPAELAPRLARVVAYTCGVLQVMVATMLMEYSDPGRYRLWVQVKTAGRVRTGAFDARVRP